MPETLGKVYQTDAQARERQLSPESRLLLHKEHSGPLLDELNEWMETQFAEHKTEPNSGFGKGILYPPRHWMKLTLYLRQLGAPSRQQHRRTRSEAGDSAPQERALL